MDEQILKHLIDESERLNDDESGEWSTVEALWHPYVAQGDVEALFRLAYYSLFCSFDVEPEKRIEMEGLLRTAAERDHPDAVYSLRLLHSDRTTESDALLLRAGELGSLEAQRDLGALYETGDWTGPQDSVSRCGLVPSRC